ncbi:MAG: GGDEF domain-containing protein [Planctomycetota bacterium]
MSEFRTPDSGEEGAGVFSLTQIRHLMRVEFGRAQRYRYPVSCIVVACDRLDHLRDLYGYEFKEAVVEDIVHLVQNSTRTCDYLGRLVDDRLLAILPHTARDGAEVTARRVLAGARGLTFTAEGHNLKVTLSVGISHFENDNTLFFDSLVEAAEEALLDAMNAGGDRCVHRDPGPGEVR